MKQAVQFQVGERGHGGASRRNALPIAVIGLGAIGRRHAETVLRCESFRLAGIAEPAASAQSYAASLGVPWFASAVDLLNAVKPAAAVIATPNETHKDLALACLARGIPILLEKPIAGSLEDALAIVRAAERTGIPVLVGHHRRHNPIVARARAALAEGLLGRLATVTVLYTFFKPAGYFDAEWRRRPGSGGPVLINLIHEIDLVRHVCGEIASVQAYTSSRARGFEVEDTATAILRLESGTLVSLSLSDTAVTPWSWDLATREFEVYPRQPAAVQTHFLCGTEGSLALPTLEHWSYRSGKSWHLPITREALAVESRDSYLEQLNHLYRVIQQAERPLVSAADAAKTLRATLAIGEAASTGRSVSLE